MSGSTYERQLVRLFVDTQEQDGVDWLAQRAASSGSATDAPLPDVTFASGGLAFACELKTSGTPRVYFEKPEVQKLRHFANTYGMIPVVAGRFKGTRAFYLWHPADIEPVETQSYAAKKGERCSIVLADPDGGAEGLYPRDVTADDVAHALTEPPEPVDPGEVAADA